MTEIEKKAEEYAEITYFKKHEWANDNRNGKQKEIHKFIYIDGYKDGYEQGQKDFDTDVTKLLNSYGVTFIDTNSIGGLIALHQLILDLEKENEELKATISKMEKVTAYFLNKKQQERKRWIINCGRRFGKPSITLPILAAKILPPEDYERFMQEYKKVVEQTEREYEGIREIMQHREGYSFVAIDEINQSDLQTPSEV